MDKDKIISARRYRWIIALTLMIGAGIGVIAVAATTEAVIYTSTTQYCGTACHNMNFAKEAYERGAHFKTASGVTAGCNDCHIPYETSLPNPFQFFAMVTYKAKAGAIDAYQTALGTIDTEEKWKANRERLSKQVEAWLVSNRFKTCRGCHDLEKFSGSNNPMVVELHAGLLKQDSFNCLECHQGVGHVYEEKKAASTAAPSPLAAARP